MFGNLFLLIGTVVLELPGRLIGVGRSTHGRARTRRQARRSADYTVREMAGELTRDELRGIEMQERYTQDKNNLEIAASLGQKTWRDSYGTERSTETRITDVWKVGE